MHRLPRSTYSSVVATLALFIALGGAAYAGTVLPRNSVGRAQIKNGAVTLPKLSKKAVARLVNLSGSQGSP